VNLSIGPAGFTLVCLSLSTGLVGPASAALSFEPAAGQYLAHTRQFTVAVTSKGARFQGNARGQERIRFLGARPGAVAQPGPGEPGIVNYYIGNDPTRWRTGVRTNAWISYHGVYPGIDVTYHGAGDSLEYDFDLSPRADVRLIRIAVSANLRQMKPVAFQILRGRRTTVEVRLVEIGAGVLGFRLGHYDKSVWLTIDPVIVYSTLLGGSGSDQADGLAVDAQGNAYISGFTTSADFPILPATGAPYGGNEDAFVAEFSATGQLIFATYLGGKQFDAAFAVALDQLGNIIVAGETNSTDFPTTTGAIAPSNASGVPMAFVTKLGPGGALVASTYLGGDEAAAGCQYDLNAAYGVAADALNNVYATGKTCATNFPGGGTLRGSYACFVASMNPALTAIGFATLIGGAGQDFCNAIAVDGAGNSYLTGASTSSGLATANAFQTLWGGGTVYGDAFVAKFTAAGTLQYYTYLGGSGDDAGNSIAIDAAGSAYAAGWTLSTNFPLKNAVQTAFAGGTGTLPCGCGAGDAFAVKLSPDGTQAVYSTYFGGSGDDAAEGVAVDATGRLYVVGSTDSTGLMAVGAVAQTSYGGVQDAFLMLLSQDGTSIDYFSYFGGSQIEEGLAVGLGSSGNVYIGGESRSPDFPILHAFQSSLKGSQNAFVAVLAITPPVSAPQIDAIVNAASFTTVIAPGSLATVFGTTMLEQAISAAGVPLPTSLGGVSVTVNGVVAALTYANATQVNFQVPSATAMRKAEVVLMYSAVASAPVTVAVQDTAPGIFTYGTNQAIAQNYPSYALNGPATGAPAGSVAIVYLTGQGPVDHPVPDGVVTPDSPLASATSPYSATIGGMSATVTFLGLVPGDVGLAQADLVVPQLRPGSYPLVITIGGMASNSALFTVK